MYRIAQTTFEPESDAGQALLAEAWKAKTRPECLCKSPAPQMYVAYVGAGYILKRMPDTGPSHAVSCESYTAPTFLSGMGQLERAVRIGKDKTSRKLAVNFSLSVAGPRAAPTPGDGAETRDIISKPTKMSLTALLEYLWLEAGLVQWHPGFHNKRWWGLVRQRLFEASEGTQVKGADLADRLFIPQAWSAEQKDAIFAQNRKRLSEITAPSTGPQKLGLLVAEYKSHEETPHGARFTFKHAPGLAFFANNDFLKRFDKRATRYLDLAAMIQGAKLLTIATFGMRKAGYPELKDMGLMLVSANWIPFDTAGEAELLDLLTTNRRSFVKSLRFDLPKETVTPHSALTDVHKDEPHALYMQRQGKEEAIAAAATTSGYPYSIFDPLDPQASQLPRRLAQQGGLA